MENKNTDMNSWKDSHRDMIVRATAAGGMIRAFAACTKNLVQEAKDRHGTSPVATAALGRLLTAGAMMGVTLKGDDDLLTLMVRGDGPLSGITVTADAQGRVKGYVNEPQVWIPLKYKGKLDVGGAVGHGTLTVVRDQAFGDPYSSQTELVSGEIAEDLTYYFATSEQVPSSVGLGVLVDTDQNVRQAGGFLIQLMPGFDDETIDRLEAALKGISSVTDMLEEGLSPEGILERILGGMDLEITDRIPTEFYCNCSRERTSRVLLSLGSKELKELIDEGKPIDLECHFCGKKYTFTVEEMEQMLAAARLQQLNNIHVIDPDGN